MQKVAPTLTRGRCGVLRLERLHYKSNEGLILLFWAFGTILKRGRGVEF